jgi:hypothetical protein
VFPGEQLREQVVDGADQCVRHLPSSSTSSGRRPGVTARQLATDVHAVTVNAVAERLAARTPPCGCSVRCSGSICPPARLCPGSRRGAQPRQPIRRSAAMAERRSCRPAVTRIESCLCQAAVFGRAQTDRVWSRRSVVVGPGVA